MQWQKSIGQIVSQLDRVLAGTPMAGTSEILVRIGRKHNVSPYFIVGAAAKESSIGEAACSNNRFNVWGLAACNGIWYVPSFGSWEEAIDFYARFLNRQWPGHSTPYSFRGYAACSQCWASWISSWMSSRFGATGTRYPTGVI